MSQRDFRFLELPRELRDQIYSHAFGQYAFESRDQDVAFHVCYGKYKASNKEPRWILANKQILSEAINQFYRHGRLAFSFYKARRDPTLFTNPIFSIRRLERLDLRLYMDVKPGKTGSRTAHIGPETEHIDLDPSLQHVLKALKGIETQLKELSIGLDFKMDDLEGEDHYRPFPNPVDVHEWKIDLSYLEAFGTSLEKVRLTLKECRISMEYSYSQLGAYSIVVPVLQKELIRLGQAMVGGESCIVTDYMSHDTDWNLEVQSNANGAVEKSLSHLGLTSWRTFEIATPGDLYLLQPSSDIDQLQWTCEESELIFNIPKPKMPWNIEESS